MPDRARARRASGARNLRKTAHLTIVIADASPRVRHFASGILELEPDITVLAWAEDTAECLALVFELEPILVLIDVSLPGGAGYAIARTITDKAPHVGVVFMNEPQGVGGVAMADAIEAGAITVIEKPALGTLLEERQRRAFVVQLWRFAAQADLRAPPRHLTNLRSVARRLRRLAQGS